MKNGGPREELVTGAATRVCVIPDEDVWAMRYRLLKELLRQGLSIAQAARQVACAIRFIETGALPGATED